MRLLHGSALESWQRYKALDLRLQQTSDPRERCRLERDLHAASQRFRRAVVEQHVRRAQRWSPDADSSVATDS